MRSALLLATARTRHAPRRTAVQLLALTVATALLGAMLLFVRASLAAMTASTVGRVPVDWQGAVPSHGAAEQLAALVRSQPGIAQALPVATAPLAGAAHRARSGEVRTGAGALLAVPTGSRYRPLRLLRGSLREGQVVLDQQLAASLQARPGDRIALAVGRRRTPVRLRVSGIAVLGATDTVFAPLNPLAGPAPAQPPANVAILPLATFVRRVEPLLPPAGTLNDVQPGQLSGVTWEVQARVEPGPLRGADPAAAGRRVDRLRGRVERVATGRVRFVDNLSDALTSAASDAIYAEALFVLLAVPGAIVGLALAYLAALGSVESDRRDLALLRARGGRRRDVLAVAVAESVPIGLAAGVLGSVLALVAVRALTSVSPPASGGATLLALAVCVALACAGALAARVAAADRVLRGSIDEARRGPGRAVAPLWQRLWLDVWCLAGSGLVYWLTLRGGFSAVVNPDANPTLTLSFFMFLAPALLWIGAALLLVRLHGRWVCRLRGRHAAPPGSLAGFLRASAARRGPAVNRGLVVVALLLGSAVETAVFTATYDQQARVDAELTIGADVAVNAPPGVVQRDRLAARIAAVPGVAATTALDHAYAYVGPDLQDTFGIDVASFRRATTLRDSYFLGGSATQVIDRLRRRPDAILVSRETILDYQLNVGDLLRLRVLDRRSGRLKVAPFHVAGVVQEFPSAPKDSFMVANLAYLQRVTGDPGPNVVFARVHGDPAAAGSRIAAATHDLGTSVQTRGQQLGQTVSSITAVDLAGISRIELAFAVALAIAATLLVTVLALVERRRELATMLALGAPTRTAASFVWSELALVLTLALVGASAIGLVLSEMLVALLRHVFDPPPTHLALPWGYLLGLALATCGSGVVAAVWTVRALRRLPVASVLRAER